MSNLEYYNDSSQHGNYQYVTLEEIVNNFMMSGDADDHTAMAVRYKVVYQAKRGIRELYYDTVKEVKAIELDLSNTLNVTLPPDFVSLVRLSWIDGSGRIHPMAMDNKMPIGDIYLQANDYSLLFDNEGSVLTSARKPQVPTDLSSNIPYNNGFSSYDVCYDNFLPNNGRFKMDKAGGLIQFSSDIASKAVVIEYISDGLYTENVARPDQGIKIHKFAETALLNYIYSELIKKRASVPANEKARAQKEYTNSKRITKRRLNALTFTDLIQVFKGGRKGGLRKEGLKTANEITPILTGVFDLTFNNTFN